ncbi:MAG: sodium:proton antiporter [Planctomycetota bacterium]
MDAFELLGRSVPRLLAAGGGGESVALEVMGILALGIGAQWIAWRLKLPSIILLLLFGLVVGPIWTAFTGDPLINPDGLLGDLLLPLVGISVGLILYEGGLTLRAKEIKGVRQVVTMLVTAGAFVTWILTSLAAWVILGLQAQLAFLLGAVLIVTGPTVIGPLLGHIRPAGSVGPVLKWEGIVIDPIGALTAVLVLEAIVLQATTEGGSVAVPIVLAIIKTVVVGGGLGVAAAFGLMRLMRGFLIPEPLQNPVSLALVVGVFTISNQIQAESGLLTATVMGIVLANQSSVEIRHILEFKENLRVLLISALFIVLAARLRLEEVQQIKPLALAGFLGIMIFLARPLSVWVSTLGSDLSTRERLFLCWMAPRGIVAAAVASIFAIALQREGPDGEPIIENSGILVAYAFAAIIATVSLYGLTSPWLAKLLGVSDENPQGIAIVGAGRFGRAMAAALRKAVDQAAAKSETDSVTKLRVLLIDTNRDNIIAARMQGLSAAHGNVLEDQFVEDLDLRGVGRALALTPNAEVNTLALQRFARDFGGSGVYSMPAKPSKGASTDRDADPADAKGATTHGSHGRRLFAEGLDLQGLESRLAEGWIIKATEITKDFTFDAYRVLYGGAAVMMFVVDPAGQVEIITAGKAQTPTEGDVVLSLVDPEQLLMGRMFGTDTPEPRTKTIEISDSAASESSADLPKQDPPEPDEMPRD